MHTVGDQLAAVLAGELDAGSARPTGVVPAVIEPFRSNKAFSVVTGPHDFIVALYWNLGAGGALADARFRHACAMAIDRSDLVHRLVGGQGLPGSPGFLPSDHPLHVDADPYPFDPLWANRLLDDAGYRRDGDLRLDQNGRPLRFKLLVVSEGDCAIRWASGMTAE